MKKILTFVLTFVLGIVSVNAYSVTEKDYGLNRQKPCDYPIISNTEKCDPNATYRVGAGEEFKINYNGKTLDAYCIDPGVAGPKNVEEISTDFLANYMDGFKYICEQTENVANKEIIRGTMIKAYSVRKGLANVAGKDPGGTKAAYNKLGDGTKFNPKYDNGSAFEILQAAEKKNGSQTASNEPTITVSNGAVTITTKIPGTIEVDNSSNYEIFINGAKQSSSYNVTAAGTYVVKLANPNCTNAETFTANVSFKYDKADLEGGSNSSYNIRAFRNPDNHTQRLITCEKVGDGEYPNCNGNVCEQKAQASVKCEGKTCEEIEFKNGAGICNEDGTTVVTIIEKPSDLNSSDTYCISKLPNATKAILGNDNNPYCNIHCSENYELNLPGPDAKTGNNESVFINAGSYFTINDENMYDKTTYTCYGKMEYDKYKTDITTNRQNVVNAYNTLSELKAKRDSIKNATQGEEGCSIADAKYNSLELTSSGKINKKTMSYPFNSPATCPGQISDSEIAAAEQALNSAINTAKNNITEAETNWKECLEWDFDEFNKILETENCETNIDFNYQFNTCNATIEKDSVNVDSPQEQKSSTSNETLYTGVCDINGENCNASSKVEAYTYINRQEVVTTKYKFNNEFTVNFETGEISCEAIKNEKHSDGIKGFPVSLDATQAKYAYEYKYTNIGHDFEAMNAGKCEMGRFDNIIKEQNNHHCYYDVNNCDDCEVICEDPTGKDCEFDFCENECQVACVGGGCILDINAGFLATYRTMSLNNPFPNSIALLSSEPSKAIAYASTKDFDRSYNTNWETAKGRTAREEIEAKGETVYSNKPQYSINLTPTIINEIKRYNEEQKADNSYLNKTLSCSGNGKNYGQCISSFVHAKNEKWKFEVSDHISDDETNVSINGINVPFSSYSDTKPFVGPAWK